MLHFLTPWPNLAEFLDKILNCFCQLSSFGDSQNLSTKVKKKEILKAACTSKKVKYINNPIIAKIL